MTYQAVVDLIAKALPALTHPGDGKPFILPLPMFRNSSMPSGMAEQFAQDAGLPDSDIAKLTAEAIVALIENDYDMIPKGEAAQLRAQSTATETHRHRIVKVGCRCGQPLFNANFTDYGTDTPKVHGPELIKALTRVNPDCSTKHQALEG